MTDFIGVYSGGQFFIVGRCYRCNNIFGFDSDKVISIRDDNGVRQPLCEPCVSWLNQIRIAQGLEPVEIPTGAYVDLENDGE